MKSANAIRPWCAKAQYKGLKQFYGGTIVMPADAQNHEIIAALESHFLEFLPKGFEIVEPICGALFFAEGNSLT